MARILTTAPERTRGLRKLLVWVNKRQDGREDPCAVGLRQEVDPGAQHHGGLRYRGPANGGLGRAGDIRSHSARLILQLHRSDGSRGGAADGSDTRRSKV